MGLTSSSSCRDTGVVCNKNQTTQRVTSHKKQQISAAEFQFKQCKRERLQTHTESLLVYPLRFILQFVFIRRTNWQLSQLQPLRHISCSDALIFVGEVATLQLARFVNLVELLAAFAPFLRRTTRRSLLVVVVRILGFNTQNSE